MSDGTHIDHDEIGATSVPSRDLHAHNTQSRAYNASGRSARRGTSGGIKGI
jgi:hypothetical protein